MCLYDWKGMEMGLGRRKILRLYGWWENGNGIGETQNIASVRQDDRATDGLNK